MPVRMMVGAEMEVWNCEERLCGHVVKVKGRRKARRCREEDGVVGHFCVLSDSRWQEQLPGLAHPEARVAEETARNDCQWVQPSRIMEKEPRSMTG